MGWSGLVRNDRGRTSWWPEEASRPLAGPPPAVSAGCRAGGDAQVSGVLRAEASGRGQGGQRRAAEQEGGAVGPNPCLGGRLPLTQPPRVLTTPLSGVAIRPRRKRHVTEERRTEWIRPGGAQMPAQVTRGTARLCSPARVRRPRQSSSRPQAGLPEGPWSLAQNPGGQASGSTGAERTAGRGPGARGGRGAWSEPL